MDTADLAKFPCIISDNVYEQFKAHDDGGHGVLILWAQESPLRFATEFFIAGVAGQVGDGRGTESEGWLLRSGYGNGEGYSYGNHVGGGGNFYHYCPREWMTEADLFLLQEEELLLQEEARVRHERQTRTEQHWVLCQNVLGNILLIMIFAVFIWVAIWVATMPITSSDIAAYAAWDEIHNKSK